MVRPSPKVGAAAGAVGNEPKGAGGVTRASSPWSSSTSFVDLKPFSRREVQRLSHARSSSSSSP